MEEEEEEEEEWKSDIQWDDDDRSGSRNMTLIEGKWIT